MERRIRKKGEMSKKMRKIYIKKGWRYRGRRLSNRERGRKRRCME